jgi:hypothetical protein
MYSSLERKTMFPMTITLNDMAQLSAVLSALTQGFTTLPGEVSEYAKQKAKIAEPDTVPTPKPTAVAHTAPVQAQSAAAATTAESHTESAAPDAYQAIGVADVNAAIIALAKAKGRDAAVAVLGEFNVAKVPELKPEQFAEVLKICKKAMA